MAEPVQLLHQKQMVEPKQQQPPMQGRRRRPVRAMGLKVRLPERSRVLILERQRQRQPQKKRVVVLVACLASVRYCNIYYIYIYIASFVVC